MKTCQRCGSTRVAYVSGKCSDCFGCDVGSHEYQGYVPGDMGIGGGDYIEFDYCLDCGQIQNKFPVPATELEENDE